MRQLIEQHLKQVGERRAVLLIGTFFLWASIALAVIVYALLQGVWTFALATWEARSGDTWRVVLAVVLWTFFGLSWVLTSAARKLWRDRRDLRWSAEASLTRTEERLFPGDVNTSYLNSLRERLVERGLEHLERTGRIVESSADLPVEERVIRLDRELRAERGPEAPETVS